MPITNTIALVASVFIIFFAIVALQRRYWTKRRAKWRAVGLRTGMTELEANQPPTDDLAAFQLFTRGHGQRIHCGVRGETWGGEIFLADTQYTTGSGRNKREHRQTVCVLRNAEATLPRFFLRPERRIIDRISEFFGLKDIDFDDDPEFSRQYLLQGDDEAAVRALFSPSVRMQIRQHSEPIRHLEGTGNRLLLSHGKLMEPEESDRLVQRTTDLLQVLAGA